MTACLVLAVSTWMRLFEDERVWIPTIIPLIPAVASTSRQKHRGGKIQSTARPGANVNDGIKFRCVTINDANQTGTDDPSIRKPVLVNNIQGVIAMADCAYKFLSRILGFEDSVKDPSLLLGNLSNCFQITEITVMMRLATRGLDFAEHGTLPFNSPCADQVGDDRLGQNSGEGACRGKRRHNGGEQPCHWRLRDRSHCRRISHHAKVNS